MPKATEQTTTSRRGLFGGGAALLAVAAAPPGAMAALPSVHPALPRAALGVGGAGEVLDLWHCAYSMRDVSFEVDEQDAAAKKAGRRLSWADHVEEAAMAREDALIALAETTPAATLGDVLAQAMLALERADDLTSNHYTPSEVVEGGARLLRLLASMLPVIARHAGIAMTDVVDAYTVERFSRFVPVVETVPAPGARMPDAGLRERTRVAMIASGVDSLDPPPAGALAIAILHDVMGLVPATAGEG